MENFDIGSLIIVGAVVSALVQLLKQAWVKQPILSMIAVIVFSLIGGSIYVAFKDTAFWLTFLQVLAYAGAVYTFFIQRFEK